MSTASRLGRRYARALFRINEGQETKAKAHLAGLTMVSQLFGVEKVARVLRSPVMPRDLKVKILDNAIDQAGLAEREAKELKSFARVIADEGRVGDLPDIAQAYADLVDESAGVIRAEVLTTVDLAEGDLAALRQSLEILFKKKVAVEQRLEPAVLGGVVVRVGNNLIDLSLKTKLEALAEAAVQ